MRAGWHPTKLTIVVLSVLSGTVPAYSGIYVEEGRAYTLLCNVHARDKLLPNFVGRHWLNFQAKNFIVAPKNKNFWCRKQMKHALFVCWFDVCYVIAGSTHFAPVGATSKTIDNHALIECVQLCKKVRR